MSLPAHGYGHPTPVIRPCSLLALQVFRLVFDEIASKLPLREAVALSHVHYSIADKLAPHLQKSFNTLLTSRISTTNIPPFVELLRDTRAVISGSTSLQFILRDEHWKPGDFDLYAPFGTGFALVDFLNRNEGYDVESDGSRSFMFHPHAIPISRFSFDWLSDVDFLDDVGATKRRKPKSEYDSTDALIYRVYKLVRGTFPSQSSIDVIESTSPSFLPPITKFHSTLVMNYITPNRVVVLYPELTFARKGVLQFRDESTLDSYEPDHIPLTDAIPTAEPPKKQDYVEKYKARGFKLYARPAELRRHCGAACPSLVREVTDRPDKWALEVRFDDAEYFRKNEEMDVLYPLSQINLTEPADSFTTSPDSLGSVVYLTAPSRSASQASSSWETSVVSQPRAAPSSVRHMPNNKLSGAAPSRPPPPYVTWSLRAPPFPLSIGTPSPPSSISRCSNPFCPLRGSGRIFPAQMPGPGFRV